MSSFDTLPRKGKVYKYKKLLFWAQGGCVCIEDTSQEGDFKVIPRHEFAARIIALREYGRKHGYRYADERIEDDNFIINGCACVKEGKHQGDPFDPTALQDILKSYSRNYVFTGDGNATVVFDPVVTPAGGTAVRHSPGPGGSVVLHTRSQDQAPAQKALLPPLPTKSDRRR
jgi:hypothetical protein